jgi:hypothetical protein
MASDIDDQLHLLLQDFAFLPVAAGTLGHPDFFVWKALAQFILRASAATVTMSGDAPRKSRRIGVTQHRDRILNQVPVVIEYQNFCVHARLLK